MNQIGGYFSKVKIRIFWSKVQCKKFLVDTINIVGDNKFIHIEKYSFLIEESIRDRRECSVSKRLVQLTRFKGFPLQLSGHQDIPTLSFVLGH